MESSSFWDSSAGAVAMTSSKLGITKFSPLKAEQLNLLVHPFKGGFLQLALRLL
jgi:hypothetical protein